MQRMWPAQMTSRPLVVVIAAVLLPLAGACGASNNRADGEPGSPGTPPADLESTASIAGPPTSPAAAGGIDEWYSVVLAGFTAGPAVDGACCASDLQAAAPSTVVWVSENAGIVQLLRLVANPTPQTTEPFSLGLAYFRTLADGSIWQFESFGIAADDRQRLADTVHRDEAGGYTLPDSSFVVAAQGTLGVGRLLSQVYAGDAQRITLSVGDYRGQLDALLEAQTVIRRTVAGHLGFELVSRPNAHGLSDIWMVWPTSAGQWASVHASSAAVSAVTTDSLADAIAPAGIPLAASPVSPDGTGQQYVGDVLVSETPDHGPMIAFVLEGPAPAGGDVLLTNWDWAAVPDSNSLMGWRWGGPWRVVGTWDGTSFTVTHPPVAVPEPTALGWARPTDECDERSFSEVREQISHLDRTAVGPFTDNVLNQYGECGIVISAFVDSDELRTLLAPFESQIARYEFVLAAIE